jgi:hypothetical protein
MMLRETGNCINGKSTETADAIYRNICRLSIGYERDLLRSIAASKPAR